MALTFPPQPQEVGTSYLAPNGTTYIWDGTKWAGVVTQGSGGTGGVDFLKKIKAIIMATKST